MKSNADEDQKQLIMGIIRCLDEQKELYIASLEERDLLKPLLKILHAMERQSRFARKLQRLQVDRVHEQIVRDHVKLLH